jgi:hypothetical protein
MKCQPHVADSAPCADRLREHLLAQLVCPGRHTITSLLTTNGRQFEDGSADYRLYARERIDPAAVFNQVRLEVEALRDPAQPLVVALDDTILRKRGKRIPGAAYRKDPLGPAFNINLVWAQRMIQLSAGVPGPEGEVRMIPIAFRDASTPRKPRRTAPAEQWASYRELLRQTNLNHRALGMIRTLQQRRTNPEGLTPPLRLLVDGSYTNRKILRNLPPHTTLIGRIRKDAHLSRLPEQQASCGRTRLYGEDAPTPEELRHNPQVPWRQIVVNVAGKLLPLRVKTLAPLRWRTGGNLSLRLIVIAPVPYLKMVGGKRRYRQPAYLICTDLDLPLERIVQEYVWRWDIETNHRDEKTLLGVGQAQVRNNASAEAVPAAAVAAYAMLHVAAIHAFGWHAQPGVLPLPKWRDPQQKKRASPLDLLNELRRELWSSAIRPAYLTDFTTTSRANTKSEKRTPSLCGTLFYATA